MQQRVVLGNGTIAITGPRAVIAAVVGNGLEWYNFMLYGVVRRGDRAVPGPILTGIGDMFPNRALATGLGLSDNTAVSVFGGTAAFMITWLIAVTGDNMVDSSGRRNTIFVGPLGRHK